MDNEIVNVLLNGYNEKPVQIALVKKSRAEEMCSKNNMKLLYSGVPEEVLVLHPEYMFFRKR